MLCMPFLAILFVTILFNKSHIARAVCHNIIYSGHKYLELKYCIYILYLLLEFCRAVLIANITYEGHKHLNYSLPHHCTLQWEEISSNYVFQSDFPLPNQQRSAQMTSVFMFVRIYHLFLHSQQWNSF